MRSFSRLRSPGAKVSSLLAAVAIVVTTAAHAGGMPTLTVAGRGNGTFEVWGEGLDGVGGVTMVLAYDGAAAADPRVTLGELFAGALMVPNLSQRGVVRVGIISGRSQGIPGSGRVLTLSLSPAAGSQSGISQFTAQAVSAAGGRDIPVQTRIGAAAASLPAATASTSPGATAAGSAGSSGTPLVTGGAVLGSVSLPPSSGDGHRPPPPPPPVTPAAADPEPVPPPAPASPAVPAEGAGTQPFVPEVVVEARGVVTKTVVARSVLDLFRDYDGERTPAALGALFAKGAPSGVRQEPPIALSDGTATVTVSLTVPAGSRSPNFALTGAKLTSLRKEGDLYLLEVRPDAGVNEVTVTILNNGAITVIPLTVVQPVDSLLIPDGTLTETGVAQFLTGISGKRKDLNGDGVVTYLDDYLLMATYLLRKKGEAPKPPASPPVPAGAAGTVGKPAIKGK